MNKYKLNFTFCHRMPERSFFWKGKQFPVCSRCTGIHVGYLSLPFFVFNIIEINLLWTIILMLPTIIDGLTQAFMNRQSNNVLRVTTGLMAGIGTMSLSALIGKFIANQILFIIK